MSGDALPGWLGALFPPGARRARVDVAGGEAMAVMEWGPADGPASSSICVSSVSGSSASDLSAEPLMLTALAFSMGETETCTGLAFTSTCVSVAEILRLMESAAVRPAMTSTFFLWNAAKPGASACTV